MPRFYMMGTYSADGMKGIVGGSDRAAAVDAVVKAVGGSLNHFSFTRGEHDIIVDVECSLNDGSDGCGSSFWFVRKCELS